MAFEERVQILSEAEQDELYGPPAFTSADQRFFFSLNDKELAIAKSLRHRGQRYMLVVLLGALLQIVGGDKLIIPFC